MSWDKVRNIRKIYKDGIMYQDQLGKKFKISQSSISRIVINKAWVEK